MTGLIKADNLRDSVGSIGVGGNKGLPFSTSSPFIKTFRHAISLDERRVLFQPNTWGRPNASESRLGIQKPNEPQTGVHFESLNI